MHYLCSQRPPLPVQVEEVPRVLKENSLASFAELVAAGTITAQRKAELDAVRKERIYIGRLDVITMKLDGTKRAMQNEAARTWILCDGGRGIHRRGKGVHFGDREGGGPPCRCWVSSAHWSFFFVLFL